VNVLASKVRMLSKDFVGCHAVRDHRDHRGNGEAQSP
jgi:hypothetical protein